MTDYIMNVAILQVNSILLIAKSIFIYNPSDIGNPALDSTIKDTEDDLVVKYFEELKDYMAIIQELRMEIFIRYARDNAVGQHKLVRQGHDVPNLNDFVLIIDEKKWNYLKTQ